MKLPGGKQTLVLGFALANTADAAHTFVTLGDWGGAALGSYYVGDVYTVADSLTATAVEKQPQFVVNTGDSFYWCGIQNTSDFQIAVDFEEPFAAPSLQVPWYSVLGNHEYGYNVSAVLEYANVNPVWVMDDRYYTKRVEIGSTGSYISFVFIDTNPCIWDYRDDDPYWWDPCGSTYPTCSLDSSDDDFEGTCMFHENILTQDCYAQFDWFQDALSDVNPDDWLIVVGHHAADEIDVKDFTSAMQTAGFDLYLNGHSHTLTHYTVDNAGAYVTSGAGALVKTTDQTASPRMEAKLRGEDWVGGPRGAGAGERPGSGHSYQTVFNNKVAGYTLHSFSDDLSELTTDYIDANTGEVIYSFTVTKGQGKSKKTLVGAEKEPES